MMMAAMALNCAARMASQAVTMITEARGRLGSPKKAVSISGMVTAPLSRTFWARNRLSTVRPTAPEPSHQKAGVPTCQARPAMPMVAEPPTQEDTMERATAKAVLRRPLRK